MAMMKEKEVAEKLKVSLAALRRWRYEGRGPRYVKVAGVAVRYPSDQLDAWINSCPSGGER
jgi:predicted DNA-binding transcriptional regulator AlpA